MKIANTVQETLDKCGGDYEVIPHRPTSSCMQTAAAAHVVGDRLAKSVILEDEAGYVMAVLPATHRVDLGTLHRQLNRKLGLATEGELTQLFADCDIGAIPPLGPAYGMETILETSLLEQPDIYFEAGNHRDIIHLSRDRFLGLLKEADERHFSHHV